MKVSVGVCLCIFRHYSGNDADENLVTAEGDRDVENSLFPLQRFMYFFDVGFWMGWWTKQCDLLSENQAGMWREGEVGLRESLWLDFLLSVWTLLPFIILHRIWVVVIKKISLADLKHEKRSISLRVSADLCHESFDYFICYRFEVLKIFFFFLRKYVWSWKNLPFI